jgi:hypothetical protein
MVIEEIKNNAVGGSKWSRGQKMTKKDPRAVNTALVSDPSLQRRKALARWDNEGGRLLDDSACQDAGSKIRQLTNAELVQLQIRMIALENIVISLLSSTSDQRLEAARDMAAYILPWPGFTQHPLTIHAANQILHLVHRAEIFPVVPPSEPASPCQAGD